MSRTSRIPHPPGSRFVSLYAWAVRRFGLAGAAILGLLDFYDRAQDAADRPTASRARIIADLEHIVGRDQVDKGLRILLDARAIKAHKSTGRGEKNWQTRVDYGLDVAGLAQLLVASGTSEIRSPGDSSNQEPRELLKSGLESGAPNTGIEIEAAAPRAHARGPINAAAAGDVDERKRRHPRRSEGGIESWYVSEDLEANVIEASASAEDIKTAVATIRGRQNAAGKPTSPVPALVREEIDRRYRELEATERRIAAEAAHQARLAATPPVDTAAVQRGLSLLPESLRERVRALNVTEPST